MKFILKDGKLIPVEKHETVTTDKEAVKTVDKPKTDVKKKSTSK